MLLAAREKLEGEEMEKSIFLGPRRASSSCCSKEEIQLQPVRKRSEKVAGSETMKRKVEGEEW